MDHLICRTCLRSNLSDFNVISISIKLEETGMAVQDMLEVFMPEMDLSISGDEAVICLKCFELLKNAYSFKKICFKTEESIYDYLYTYSVQMGQTVSLQHVLEYEASIFKPKDTIVDSKVVIDLDSSNSSVRNDSNENIILLEELSKVVPNEQPEVLELPSNKRKNATKDSPSKKRLYSCDSCEYKISKYSLLKSHKLSHGKETPTEVEKIFKCELCSYKGKTKYHLKRHMFTHNKSDYQCEICKKCFQSVQKLSAHTRNHNLETELPHKCRECDMRFMVRPQLRLHVEQNHFAQVVKCPDCCTNDCRHCGFECEKCGDSFSKKTSLHNHIANKHT